MNSLLATTGTALLLEQLSPFVPDGFINGLQGFKRRPGPRSLYSPAQLYRVHLLALLTPAHSFNLLVDLLGENRSWRRFARLSHRERVPDAKMLHQFRDLVGVAGLRRINQWLLSGLLDSCVAGRKTVAIIDSTDLPAATNAYKKSPLVILRPGLPWVVARASTGTVGGLWATKSTLCDCGLTAMPRVCCWCRWFRGLLQPIAEMRCFCVQACSSAITNWNGCPTSF